MKPRHVILLIMIILISSGTITNQISVEFTKVSVNKSSIISTQYASDIAAEVYHQASEDLFLEIIQDLTSFGPRPYLSETNELARNWLVSKLNDVSNNKLEVEIRGFTDTIVARLPGTLDNSVCFMVGGHYDTLDIAPGANDDGTGVATTIELARILSQYDWPLDIYFCLWNAEEVGLVGSADIAGNFFSEEIDILCYYNIDMLLVQNENAPINERVLLYYTADYTSSTRDTHYTIYQDSQYWAELVQTMNYNYGTPIIKPYPHSSTSIWLYSDHYPFFAAGYKSAMFFFESGSGYDTAYHTAQDTWDNALYDYSLTKPVVASIGASIAYAQSRALGQKFTERYSLILGPHSSKELKFQSTIATGVTVNATTNDGSNLRFEALSPIRALLGTESPGIMNMDHHTVLTFTSEEQGQHSIVVRNEGIIFVDLEIEFVYDTDLEGDSIPDSTQEWYNRFLVDSDLDSINDMYEMQRGIDRFDADTDHDTIPDNEEIYIYNTFPYEPDSDFDSMPDNWEIFYNLNPRNRNDKLEDPDNDFLNNIGEFREGTNPRLNDSDYDSILDGIEISEYHTSPLSNDSDHDLMPDAWEIEHGLNPLVDDALLDPDEDGKSNIEEYLSGEDPNVNSNLSTQTTPTLQSAPIIILSAVSILAVVVVLGIKLRLVKDYTCALGIHNLNFAPISGEPATLS